MYPLARCVFVILLWSSLDQVADVLGRMSAGLKIFEEREVRMCLFVCSLAERKMNMGENSVGAGDSTRLGSVLSFVSFASCLAQFLFAGLCGAAFTAQLILAFSADQKASWYAAVQVIVNVVSGWLS